MRLRLNGLTPEKTLLNCFQEPLFGKNRKPPREGFDQLEMVDLPSLGKSASPKGKFQNDTKPSLTLWMMHSNPYIKM